MPELILGPLLRTVEDTAATVWVELDGPGEVEVLGHRAESFAVADHHYAVVIVRGLEAGGEHPYDVRVDGETVWPLPDAELPPPTIRTLREPPHRIVFGSCRAAAPERRPWTCAPGTAPQGRGHDALLAYARDVMAGRRERPDLLLLLGDQVYADDASPETRDFIRSRRDTSVPPGEDVNDLDEYARLYRESWSVPALRWLLGSVPSAMIFDDHDVIDDWNISAAWLEDARAEPWWDERITSALASYWVYQHLGNLRPDELAEDPLLAEAHTADDAAGLLRDMARRVDRDPGAFRWSFDRWLGDAHLVVVDSRAARTFAPERDMLDPAEWQWLEERLTEPTRHLVVGTSLPVILPEGIVLGQQWSEAVAEGRWGRRAARAMERIRRAVDLEHWPAFRRSFDRLLADLREVATRPDRPASVLLLSGDVHVGYTAELAWPVASHSPTWQLTASPMRNRIPERDRRLMHAADSAAGRLLGRALALSAGLRGPEVDWTLRDGPVADNHVAVLTLDGDVAHVQVEAAVGGPDELPRLETAYARRLA